MALHRLPIGLVWLGLAWEENRGGGGGASPRPSRSAPQQRRSKSSSSERAAWAVARAFVRLPACAHAASPAARSHGRRATGGWESGTERTTTGTRAWCGEQLDGGGAGARA